ncbi:MULTISPECIES: RagB/SusD family nutrient uptake outer membrane protein [unclassified Proteiniphilum]|uniref:RagB/SusD family nutrient uptake outer membrane protein n=1 Tax=Proteiniphilum sp. UBA5310 TaxID=1947275 RepID=UPI00257DEBBC|nr:MULTISPECIES: RagB/SusD family nutrient uptake outer membrane protein [unclassified Proteiniphilum]
MNRIIKYAAVILITLGFQFCSLDTPLYQHIPTEDAYEGIQDVQNGLNGAYQRFGYYTFYGRNVPALSDMISDISVASASTGHFVSINQWSFNEYDSYILDIWSAGYNLIDRCVRGINGGTALIESAQKHNFSAEEVSDLHGYVAQFYALRAMSNLMLVNIYGLPYQAGTANSQKGIVLVTTQPIKEFEQVKRATVGETYTQILADIAKAKEHLNQNENKDDLNQYYFNEAAIYALEARSKLYMQDYSGAKASAQEAIDLRDSGDETFESYVAMWKSTAITKEDIFTIVKSDNDNLSANALNTLYGSYRASISTFARSKFAANDIRRGLISGTHPAKFDGTATAQAVSNIPVFRKSEMYLIIAEANLRGATVDIPAAQEALFYSAHRNKDIESINDLPSTKDELIKFISDERIREFFQEGHRYFDLRRTGEKATINGVANYQMSSFVFPIPDEEVQAGFGVEQNTEWYTLVPKK